MRRIIPSVCIALAWAVTLGAQSAGTGQATDPYQKMSSGDKTATLTGCLREGETPGTYVLTNVDASALRDLERGTAAGATAERPSTPPATGTSGTGSADQDTKVELTAGGNVNLNEHVGHQVEVTGMLAWGKKDDRTGTTGTTGSTGTPSATAGMGDKNVHKLNVRSVKMVSATCSM